ncbi:MAG: cell division protein SepF [Candidatus Woesearchaeota archaeon]
MVKNFLSKIKKSLTGEEEPEEAEQEYVELDTMQGPDTKTKVIVRPFQLEDFSDVKPILDALREGYTIALVNIKPIKDKDMVELKRSINKIKKTCDAINGDIAGFGEDYIVVTPSFAEIYRNKQTKDAEDVEEKEEKDG